MTTNQHFTHYITPREAMTLKAEMIARFSAYTVRDVTVRQFGVSVFAEVTPEQLNDDLLAGANIEPSLRSADGSVIGYDVFIWIAL